MLRHAMFEPGPGVRVDGGAIRALRSRRVKDGVHVFPTASSWLPVVRDESSTWRVRVEKMANGMAIGVKTPWLDDGRVFGRKASVGMVWWLGNDGLLHDGNLRIPSISVPRGDEIEAPPVNLKFGEGDVVEVAMEFGRLHFRVNQGERSDGVQVLPSIPVLHASPMSTGVSRRMSVTESALRALW